MREKPDFLNYKDVGYLISDNHVNGPFLYHVIYPNREYKGTFCLYDTAMTQKETMIDILPDWNHNNYMEECGCGAVTFEELYNATYIKIDDLFYKNIAFYSDIILYNTNTKYVEYKTWFCRDKKSVDHLWAKLKKREIAKINNHFKENYII